jgi:hypothetical protein
LPACYRSVLNVKEYLIRWGVSAARKGGLPKDMTWNAMPLQKIEQWLKKKNSTHIMLE